MMIKQVLNSSYIMHIYGAWWIDDDDRGQKDDDIEGGGEYDASMHGVTAKATKNSKACEM